jgi:DNA-binding NtrC family response regulator
MHRAVLLASGTAIGSEAIILTGGEEQVDVSRHVAGIAADVVARAPVGESGGMIGRTVADVERDLILGTLSHCLGNRTHAATILGISIRTLRNKLKQYSQEGVAVPMPGDGERASA